VFDMVNINGIASWNPLTWLGEGKTPEAVKALEDFFKNKDGTFDMNKVLGIGGAGIGGLMGLLGGGSTANQPQGYQGGIPQYTYNRQQVPYQDENRRPGSGGRRYFNDGQFVPGAAQGGGTTNPTKEQALREQNPMGKIVSYMGGGKIPQYQQGGLTSLRPRGMYLGGKTDGMADRVPATISGRRPAQLSDGEFVMPADVVSHLGNGNSDAGAQQLFAMMDRIRKARTGRTQQGPQINPSEFTMA
tara:strand:- start:676 stop:1410 length:735 start_codon:yes stop_codon:yes gene_type:complete